MDPKKIPRQGSVIHYSCLWSHEHKKGNTEDKKDRPCIVIRALSTGVCAVAPVIHRKTEGTTRIEVPSEIKRQLGFDEDQSWSVASELNRVTWPGIDCVNGSTADDMGQFGSIRPKIWDNPAQSIRPNPSGQDVHLTKIGLQP